MATGATKKGDRKHLVLHQVTESQEEVYLLAGPQRNTSTTGACVSIIKCVVGAGSFFLPYGLKNSGLWGGVIGLLVLGILCDYIDWRIIQCKRKVFQHKAIGYADLAEATLGRAVGVSTSIFMLIQGLGACAVYVVFCGDLLQSVEAKVTMVEWIAIVGFVEILLSWLKEFKWIGLTSILGDLSLLLGVIVVFVYGFKDGGFKHSVENYPAFRFLSYPQFFGSAAFLFSITMYLFPIESSMKKPNQFNIALHLAFFTTTVMNVIFAVFGYMFFSEDVKGIVIDNLGTTVFVTLARIALVLDLVFTFVVVFVPCRDVAEQAVLQSAWVRRINTKFRRKALLDEVEEKAPFDKQIEDGEADLPINACKEYDGRRNTLNEGPLENDFSGLPHWQKIIVRTLMIIAVIGLAMAVPKANDLVGIIVGVSNSVNSFILPTIIYLKVDFDEKRGRLNTSVNGADVRTNCVQVEDRESEFEDFTNSSGLSQAWAWIKNLTHWTFHILIILLGIAAGITTTVEAFLTVIQDYS